MNTKDLIKQHFERLVEEGRKILDQAGWDCEHFKRRPAEDDYNRFRTEAMNLVQRSCGERSDHYRELKRFAETSTTIANSYYFIHCFGILEAAQRDFEADLLFDMYALITAEVIGDFVEQSEALLEAGYHIPAASLAGAILEDTLRKLCEKNNIKIPKSTKIDSLNSELAGRAFITSWCRNE